MEKDNRKIIALGKGSSGGGGDAVWGSITGTLSNQTDLMTELNKKANTSSLSTVATSGSYNDLSNKPTIPAAQIQSDWDQTDTTSPDYIKNKPTIPAAQVNSDWNAVSGVAQILNKPSMSTETLTFVDANNVSTTVVVYTQPQI